MLLRKLLLYLVLALSQNNFSTTMLSFDIYKIGPESFFLYLRQNWPDGSKFGIQFILVSFHQKVCNHKQISIHSLKQTQFSKEVVKLISAQSSHAINHIYANAQPHYSQSLNISISKIEVPHKKSLNFFIIKPHKNWSKR